jgi:hypothetical protein
MKTIRLTESELVRIVKKILNEETSMGLKKENPQMIMVDKLWNRKMITPIDNTNISVQIGYEVWYGYDNVGRKIVESSKVIIVETALDGRREYVRKWVGDEYSVGVIVPKKVYAASVYIPLTRTSPVVGQQVYSTGYPFNIRLSYASGHVSAIFKEGTNSLVQLDMAIAPGMSGSPVFNCRAQPIGFILGHLSWSSSIGFANDVSEALAGKW